MTEFHIFISEEEWRIESIEDAVKRLRHRCFHDYGFHCQPVGDSYAMCCNFRCGYTLPFSPAHAGKIQGKDWREKTTYFPDLYKIVDKQVTYGEITPQTFIRSSFVEK
jgi:hypothetical protein